MTSGINPSSQVFLSNLTQIQNRIRQAEQQLSSGLRVSVASDAPDQISGILQLRAQIGGVQQTQENLSMVGPLVDSAGSAIQQAIQVLDTATSLAAEASGSTSSASQRLQIAPQVQAILQQLVSLSQTSMNGQYIFSGDQSGAPAYAMNAAGDGVQQLMQPGPPGQVRDANGVPLSIGLTAQQIFDDRDVNGDPTPDNVFAAVSGLLASLQNDDSSGIQTALTNLKTAGAHLNDQSSFYGAAHNNISAASNSAAMTQTQLVQQLSNAQDADVAQASLDLNFALTNEQAAMAAQAQNRPQSLFDYLG